MTINRPSSSTSDQAVPSSTGLWGMVKGGFGYAWKTVTYLPLTIYTLILRISALVKSVLLMEIEVSPTRMSPIVKKDETLDTAKTDKFNPNLPKESETKDQLTDDVLDLQTLFENTVEETPSTRDSSAERQTTVDPMLILALITPTLDMQAIEAANRLKPSESTELKLNEKLLFLAAQEVVLAAKDLCKADIQSRSYEEYLLLTDDLTKQHDMLIQYAKTLENESPRSYQMVEETIKALKLKLAEVGKEVVQMATSVLQEVEESVPVELKDYLALTDRIDKEGPIRRFASKFEKSSPNTHQLVQKTMAALESKKTALDKELCSQVKNYYIPNEKIKGDGSCLFWSMDDLLKTNKGARHYRKMAATYIREHAKDFEMGVHDVMTLPGEAKSKLDSYTKLRGGKEAWGNKLEKKLGRKPSEVDFYCDCLEYSSLWGGMNELFAFSEDLEATIIVFTQQDESPNWRVDLMVGHSKYPNKVHKVFYKGYAHYQNLIEKK